MQTKRETLSAAAPAPAAATQPAKPAIISAEKNSFAEVTAKLDPGGSFYLYLSTEKVLSGLSNHLAVASNFVSGLPNIPGDGKETMAKVFAAVSGVVKDSGVSQISGLGMSSIAREPGFYYNKVILHHYAGQNAGIIWSLFGQSPHPLKEMDFLPENTALAGSSDFDLPMAWTNIVQVVQSLNIPEAGPALDQLPAKFSELTGLDLDATLKSLGGEYGLILTLDTNKPITVPLGAKSISIPNPGLCLVFKVNSDLIFDRVSSVVESNPFLGKMLIKTDEPGLKMRTVFVPNPFVELRPSIARVGDYLLLANSDSVVREMIAVSSGKKKGFKSTEAFKKLSQGVPDQGNNFTLATTAFGGALRQIQESALAGENMDPDALKSFQQMMQSGVNYGSYSVGANGPEGWEGVGNGGSQGGQMIVVPAVAAAGLLASIAIPNFVKARTTSQENACINNLRLIDAAKQQWALENNKKSTDTPTRKDLQRYLGRGVEGEWPVCPAGGEYTIGAVNEKPTCSIAGHALP